MLYKCQSIYLQITPITPGQTSPHLTFSPPPRLQGSQLSVVFIESSILNHLHESF